MIPRTRPIATLWPALLLSAVLPVSSLFAAQASHEEQVAGYAQEAQRAMRAGDFAAARENFEKLAKLEPGVAEVHASLGAVYFKLRQYDMAVQEIHAALKLKPSLPRLDSLLGLSYAEMGKFEEALPGLEKGFKQTADKDTRRLCGLQLLRVYTALHRDTDAMDTVLALNRAFPDDPEVLYHAGRVTGNYAYVLMEKLHRDAPDSIWMLQAQGEATESEKNYDVALGSFQRVLQLDPRRPGIHYRLGRVYLKRYNEAHQPGDRESARHEFEQELTLDPTNGNATYELAEMAAEDNNFDEAQKQFEAVLARFPDFQEALVGLGGVLLSRNAAQQAIAPLEHATKIDPADDVAWYRLARAQRAVGNREAAQQAMTRFQNLHDAVDAQRRRVDDLTPQTLDKDAHP